MTAVTRVTIQEAVRELGLQGQPLCVHSSMRSLGHVEGGAQAVVDGFLAEGCTVLVPAFSSYFAIAPPKGMRPERNGWDYSVRWALPESTNLRYIPASNVIDSDMGAIPRHIVDMEGRQRGDHPLNSFAAIGPGARGLVCGQSWSDVYSPIRRLADSEGYVVLIGVGLDRMTALHLAEQNAGRTLFRRWADDPYGNPRMVEIGSCSNGFSNLDSAVAPVERKITVGESRWRVFPVREALKAVERAIRQQPEITRCDDPGCGRCDDAIAGGPLLQFH